MIFTMVGCRLRLLHNCFFEEVPIYRASKNFITLQILQLVSFIRKCLKNIEGSDPKGLKFTMLSLVLSGRIPLEHNLSQLEILFSALPTKGLLDLLLMVMCSIHYLLSSLLCFYHIMNPSNHIIRLFLVVLGKLCYWQGKLRGKNCFSPIYKMERRDA